VKDIIVQSKIKDYRVKFEEDFKFLERLGKTKCVLMVDKNVYELYGKIINKNFKKRDVFIIEANESNKTINKAIEIYRYLIEKSAKRSITIISLGGGIIQDITGFVTSTLYRGVNWIFIPTTLLSQTDSCIGSKTSLNFKSYKNLIGTFYPPSEVHICVDFIYTLKKVDFMSGMGEAIKLQLMKKAYPKNFKRIVKIINKAKTDKLYLSKLINENLKVKYSYFQHDEFDLGERNLLNYGHCFGHALETSSDYYVPHGTAVIIGMIFSHIISLKRRLIGEDVFNYLNANLLIPNIEVELKQKYFRYSALLGNMKKDKKRIDKGLALILPNSEFKMFKIIDFSERELKEGIELLLRILLN